MSPSSAVSSAVSSAAPSDFSGLWVPLITPFRRDGVVDHASLTALVRRLAPTGIAGFVVCGSTGEAAALDEVEQLAVLATVAAAAPALPRVMGLSGYHLGKTLDWVRRLADQDLCGLLVPAPSYIRPSQRDLLTWFTAIADASRVPLIVYDIPYRTGATLSLDTLRALATHPRVRALKDCGGDMAKTRALIADGALQVLAGEDAQIFSTVAEGGAGAIAASTHVETAKFVQVLRLIGEGRLAEARPVWQALQPLIALLFAEPNPAPIKAWLADAGVIGDGCLRAPMTPASNALRERLRAAAQAEG